MHGRTWVTATLCTFIGFQGAGDTLAQRDDMPIGYPQSIETDLQALLTRLRDGKPSAELLVRVSSTYFDLADDLLTDEKRRREAYEAGAKVAQQAFELDESNADAHFFHAVNLGSAERLKGLTNAAMVVKEITRCAQRAIDLNPNHAQALQFMGGLLIDLPWFLGGDERKAHQYLERAVAADTNYTNAHLLLAKLYMKEDRITEARAHLEAVIHAERPRYRYTWERKYKPEAERLLREIVSRDSSRP
jgi:tetratricopeptide (TPR) repeat protein